MPRKKKEETQKVVIPKGMIDPNETTIIEIPALLRRQPVLIARRRTDSTESFRDQVKSTRIAPSSSQQKKGDKIKKRNNFIIIDAESMNYLGKYQDVEKPPVADTTSQTNPPGNSVPCVEAVEVEEKETARSDYCYHKDFCLQNYNDKRKTKKDVNTTDEESLENVTLDQQEKQSPVVYARHLCISSCEIGKYVINEDEPPYDQYQKRPSKGGQSAKSVDSKPSSGYSRSRNSSKDPNESFPSTKYTEENQPPASYPRPQGCGNRTNTPQANYVNAEEQKQQPAYARPRGSANSSIPLTKHVVGEENQQPVTCSRYSYFDNGARNAVPPAKYVDSGDNRQPLPYVRYSCFDNGAKIGAPPPKCMNAEENQQPVVYARCPSSGNGAMAALPPTKYDQDNQQPCVRLRGSGNSTISALPPMDGQQQQQPTAFFRCPPGPPAKYMEAEDNQQPYSRCLASNNHAVPPEHYSDFEGNQPCSRTIRNGILGNYAAPPPKQVDSDEDQPLDPSDAEEDQPQANSMRCYYADPSPKCVDANQKQFSGGLADIEETAPPPGVYPRTKKTGGPCNNKVSCVEPLDAPTTKGSPCNSAVPLKCAEPPHTEDTEPSTTYSRTKGGPCSYVSQPLDYADTEESQSEYTDATEDESPNRADVEDHQSPPIYIATVIVSPTISNSSNGDEVPPPPPSPEDVVDEEKLPVVDSRFERRPKYVYGADDQRKIVCTTKMSCGKHLDDGGLPPVKDLDTTELEERETVRKYLEEFQMARRRLIEHTVLNPQDRLRLGIQSAPLCLTNPEDLDKEPDRNVTNSTKTGGCEKGCRQPT